AAGAGALEVGDLQIGILSDVYLSGVWVAALDRLVQMAEAMAESALADSARAIRAKAIRTLEERLWMPRLRQYGFALLQDRSVNPSLTAWPATAMSFGVLDPTHGAEMAARLASSTLMTDWGSRPLAATSPLFDPLHYNNGAVWPFVTGWVALAEYRYHNAPAGWFALQAIVHTGFDFSLGRNPEVFSGRLYQPLDTAVPQQFFATSMVLTPLLRGLLGIEVDVPARRVRIAPHLPVGWDSVAVDHLPVGGERWSLVIRRSPGRIAASVRRPAGSPEPFELSFSPALPLGARTAGAGVTQEPTPGDLHATVRVRVGAAAELRVSYKGGWSIVAPPMPPVIGSRSVAPRVLSERLDSAANGSFAVSLEGLAGRSYAFRVQAPDAPTALSLVADTGPGGAVTLGEGGGRRAERVVTITFPASDANEDGYVALRVTFRGRQGR
ncbi:MAG TPA: hypothetical protein VGP61_12185, partial [Gemmatimonadales bacterium]|nr:hypothetical protein [Gemmatimonadales bacterium]